jgi:hypothetical protein
MGRTKKLLCAVAVCATAVVGVGASAAYAGEVGGNGEPVTIHANSPCAFSGLEDQNPGSGVVQPGEVQNWGHTKGTPADVSSPRGASDLIADFGGGSFEWGCNGHLHGLKGATP